MNEPWTPGPEEALMALRDGMFYEDHDRGMAYLAALNRLRAEHAEMAAWIERVLPYVPHVPLRDEGNALLARIRGDA